MKELSIITVSFHHLIHFSTQCSLVSSLSPLAPQTKVVSGFVLPDLLGISYSLPYLTSALFDTVAQFLLCKINFFLWFPSPYSHSYFSAYSIVLLYLLFMDWNLQHSVFGTCHFSHCNSSLGQTGGPKIGFPDPNLLLLVPNGLLFSIAHRYTNSIMSTIKPLIFTSASL